MKNVYTNTLANLHKHTVTHISRTHTHTHTPSRLVSNEPNPSNHLMARSTPLRRPSNKYYPPDPNPPMSSGQAPFAGGRPTVPGPPLPPRHNDMYEQTAGKSVCVCVCVCVYVCVGSSSYYIYIYSSFFVCTSCTELCVCVCVYVCVCASVSLWSRECVFLPLYITRSPSSCTLYPSSEVQPLP